MFACPSQHRHSLSKYDETHGGEYVFMPDRIKTHRQETFSNEEYNPRPYQETHRHREEILNEELKHSSQKSHTGNVHSAKQTVKLSSGIRTNNPDITNHYEHDTSPRLKVKIKEEPKYHTKHEQSRKSRSRDHHMEVTSDSVALVPFKKCTKDDDSSDSDVVVLNASRKSKKW